ncbi:diguanylate cyclase domain-containing protein [Arcobacter sp. CECT 8985]|uniref:diguanylate cyclase domain-containing protein n=1 Tax=Arcobacter sp. CECT 8985 TaxID=1935424 RepID=UPI00100BB7A8|nr:diguanylate cyclase [Arcobacter sp. CECT 8985]RXJ87237.1 diguanylate cyclase [Arcobacter sp. CECT 8985]
MFKNPLFVKLLLIFTLPAVGILYFSSILVYEKIDTLGDVSKIKNNVDYIVSVEKLLSSIDKERTYSVLKSQAINNKKKLKKQIKITNIEYKHFLEKMNKYADFNNLISANIQKEFHKLSFIRKQVENNKINNLQIINGYSSFNVKLLRTLQRMKPIKYETAFNSKFHHIFDVINAKEYSNLEKLYVSLFIQTGIISDALYKKFINLNIKQDIYIQSYLDKIDVKDLELYNENIDLSIDKRLDYIKNNIKSIISSNDITFKDWWFLSSKKNEQLNDLYNSLIKEFILLTNKKQKEATRSQIVSLSFLFICFVTLISLLFVLKYIVFNQQSNFNKLKKQQSLYKIISKLNKVILKIDNKKSLYKKLLKVITKDSNLSFGLIYTVKKNQMRLSFVNGILKSQIEIVEDMQRNLFLKKAIMGKKNIIKNSNLQTYSNLKIEDIKKHKIKSMGIFPIYKFDKVVSLIVLYSKRDNFFDSEIVILFNKLFLDIEYALEKLDYERNKAKQDEQLRIASYAFESNEPMIITNSQAKIINANQAFCNIMGYKREEILGKNPNIFKSDEHSQGFYFSMWDSIIKKGNWSGEIYNRKKDSTVIPLKATITAIKDKNSQIKHYLSQYNDISEQKLKQQYLEYQATHDNLTTLPNRLLLIDRMEHTLSKVSRYKTYAGVIFIDLDNFKTVNDTMGHETGDVLLRMVSKKLQETVRDEDTIARIGGDEFIVLADSLGLDKASARNSAQILASKIKGALNDIKTINGFDNISTPSIGITLFNDDTFSVKELIKQSDAAMYMAKRSGKNAICFFE